MKKLLVWDGDGTLWQGNIIAGDVPFINEETIKLIESLYERGVVQSIASWNIQSDVMEILESYHIAQYFLYPQIEMGKPKPVMMKTIKDELDLSKWEDIAFVDDEASNREEVLACFPKVLTIEPSKLEQAVRYFFTKDSYTEEDRLRVRRYEQERTRKIALKEYPGDRIAFLKSCDIHLEIELADVEQADRVYDLMTRANRMSAVSVRYSPSEVIELIERQEVHVAHIWDKFGDYGLSAVTFTKRNEEGVRIDALVVSCRLQGKGIGSSLITYHMNRAVGKTVFAHWSQNEYNTSFVDLYKFLDFNTHIVGDTIFAFRNVPKEFEYPEWISL